MTDEAPAQIDCATYTHARRHPVVIGQIAGWSPPFQLTLAQICMLFFGFIFMARTAGLWAVFLPRPVAILVTVVVPGVLAWLVRRVRIEGRNIARAAVGFLALLLSPSTGTNGGRRYRLNPAADLRRTSIYVAVDDREDDR